MTPTPVEKQNISNLNQARLKTKRDSVKAKATSKPASNVGFIELGIILLLFAIPNDLIDIGNFTGVWKIITVPIDIVTLIGFWVWSIFRLRRFPTKRFIVTTGGELVYLIGIIPFCTLFILSIAIEQHTKIGEKIFKKIRRSTIKK